MMHIILLRGLAREAAHWLEFPARLHTAIGQHCHLHIPDFPGCGKYFRTSALDSIEAMTDHARAEADIAAALASGEPVFIVGISMGGMVALDWAQRFPQDISGIVLINSSAGDQPLSWRLQPAAWPTVLLALLLPVKQREARVLRLVSNDTVRYSQHLQQWLDIQAQRPITRTTVVKMLRAAAQFRPRKACSVKGLVLASQKDRMVSPRASAALAQRFQWPLVYHPSAGHDMPMDDADWVVQEIRRWVTSARGDGE